MKSIKLPDIEILNSSFYIDEKFRLIHKAKCGNAEGRVAGNVMPSGYIRINCKGKLYLAHRIIFKMHNKVDPLDMEVDHINGDKTDNNPENLRLATRSQNRKNTSRYSSNKCGFKGVWFDKRYNSYFCAIQSEGNRVHFGPFRTAEEASEKYEKEAKSKFGKFYKDNSNG
ncbi:homing endonuclease [Vibrio phage vB_VviC_ZQ26]|nr:homing endonuclease [Vibrio phage vB_VviC_ZQ26]